MSALKTFLPVGSDTVIYWLCCRGLDACVGGGVDRIRTVCLLASHGLSQRQVCGAETGIWMIVKQQLTITKTECQVFRFYAQDLILNIVFLRSGCISFSSAQKKTEVLQTRLQEKSH